MSNFEVSTWCVGLGLLFLTLWPPQIYAQDNPAKDPVLHQYIQETINRHPVLEKARAELDAAEARARGKSRSLYNPELEFGYEEGEDQEKTVGVSKTFDLFGKRRSRARVGSAEVEAAQASLEIARKTLLFDLLSAITDYKTAEKVYSIARQRVALTDQFLDLAERRYRAGDLPLNDLLTARLALSEAKAELNEAETAFELAKADLAALVGPDIGFWPNLPGKTPSSDIDLAAIRQEDLPELRYARAVIQINRYYVQVAKRFQYPDPTVGVRVGEENAQRLIGVRLSIPIPVLNTFREEVEAAGADVIAAEQSYRVLQRELQATVKAAHDRFVASRDAWEEWESGGALRLQEQRALIQRLWEVGEISAVDFLIQLNQTFTVERAAIALEGRVWTTWFQWLDATANLDEWVERLI